MDKEKIEKRIKSLEAAKEQMIANLNAIIGSINECKFWIEELSREDKEQESL